MSKDDEPRYDVAVWDYDGNIIKALWDVTWEEAEDLREQYKGDHLLDVVITER